MHLELGSNRFMHVACAFHLYRGKIITSIFKGIFTEVSTKLQSSSQNLFLPLDIVRFGNDSTASV